MIGHIQPDVTQIDREIDREMLHQGNNKHKTQHSSFLLWGKKARIERVETIVGKSMELVMILFFSCLIGPFFKCL